MFQFFSAAVDFFPLLQPEIVVLLQLFLPFFINFAIFAITACANKYQFSNAKNNGGNIRSKEEVPGLNFS